MTTTELVFVRHGETRSNLDQLLHGRTDVPLTTLGTWQAQRVAERIAGLGVVHSLFSSPLTRAIATASAISNRIGLQTQIEPNLAEYDFGDFEGFTLARIEESHPELFQRVIDFSDIDFRFPNGESRREFNARVGALIGKLLMTHAGERLVVVAHGGVIASAVAQLTGADPNDWSRFLVHNCSLTWIQMNGASTGTLACWNDTIHLEDGGDSG